VRAPFLPRTVGKAFPDHVDRIGGSAVPEVQHRVSLRTPDDSAETDLWPTHAPLPKLVSRLNSIPDDGLESEMGFGAPNERAFVRR
jgi:hypothetical protein